MPIPPRPSTFQCPKCNWRKTVTPRSDALVTGVDWFSECPECGYSPLQRSSASQTDIFVKKVKDLFNK